LEWWYVADKAEPITVPQVGGVPQRRPLMVDPPCGTCPKIPDDGPKTRFRAIEFTDNQWLAWRHYRRCKAVGRFEEDEAVEVVAEHVGEMLEAVDKVKAGASQSQLISVLAMATMKRGK
jgi:hypothetical protein